MSVSIIDGTITEAVPGRRAMGVRYFKRLVFQRTDGSSHTVAKAMVHADLAERMQPGSSGRFYTFAAFDHRGVHGYRDDHGRASFHFPRNSEIVLGIVLVPVALWVFYVLFAWAGIPIFWTILLVLGVISLIHYRHVRHEAERQFAADTGSATGLPPATEPHPAS
ncbi:MAG: hypothetical protein ACXWUN_06335 [Allosphingosinicella sp.]